MSQTGWQPGGGTGWGTFGQPNQNPYAQQPQQAQPSRSSAWRPAPQGFGQPQGPGQPQGFGQLQGFGQPQGPGQPQGFGRPAPAVPARSAQPRRSGRGGLIAAVAVTALVVGGLAGTGGAVLGARSVEVPAPVSQQPLPGGQTEPVPAGSIPQIASNVLPSTVTILVDGGTGGTGSGFLFDDQGHIATNNHVVEAASGGAVDIMFPDGTIGTAQVVGRSPSYDVAVIQADAPVDPRPIPLGDSDAVEVGETTVAFGSPLGLGGTVTSGIVSATERPLSVGGSSNADDAVAYINGVQTDAAINPGNSGGPLVNGSGEVIGINSAILTMGNGADQGGSIGVGFAIPINQAKQVIDEILETGSATYPVIGVTVAGDAGGVRVDQVDGAGPASRAGLTTGDIVEAVDGRPVLTVTEFIVRLRTHRPGDQVALTLRDRGEVTVTLDGKVG